MIKSIREASLANKNVLIRVDLNVPFEKGKVSDYSRITAIVPTIRYVIEKGGRPVLMSHFGRPKHKSDNNLSLKRILPILKDILKIDITFCNCLDEKSIKALIKRTPTQKLILLENTRFFDGEESNSPKLSKMFSGLCDIFCNDAFSASHRAHASIAGVAGHLPSYSGLLLEKELIALTDGLLKPKTPVVAVIGGSKVSTKITLLNNLVQKVDHIVIGGGMANTFLFAQNKEIGLSLCEKNLIHSVHEVFTHAKTYDCKIHLPLDIVCANTLTSRAQATIFDTNLCPKNEMILDAGPKTVENIKKILKICNTLIWNGPLGAFEIVPFDASTNAIAIAAALLTKEKKLLSIAGGGDTVSALNSTGVINDFSYISNAGGAFLEWMEGKNLPGLAALSRNN